jgi:hypothetical protein
VFFFLISACSAALREYFSRKAAEHAEIRKKPVDTLVDKMNAKIMKTETRKQDNLFPG